MYCLQVCTFQFTLYRSVREVKWLSCDTISKLTKVQLHLRNIRPRMCAPIFSQINKGRHINNSKWPIYKGKLNSPHYTAPRTNPTWPIYKSISTQVTWPSTHSRSNFSMNNTHYNIVIHRIWAVLQSDWLNYLPYISSYTASIVKNKMAVQKLHEFCEAEKRKFIRFEKDDSTRKDSQKNLTG